MCCYHTPLPEQQKAKDQPAEQQSHLLKPLDIAVDVVEACRITRYFHDRAMGDYRIAPMEYNSDDKESKILHLFDSRTRKEIVLPDVEQIQYYDADRAVYYEQADTAGNMKTILMSLPSGVKTEWTYKESFLPCGRGSLFGVCEQCTGRYGQPYSVFRLFGGTSP